MDGTFSFAGYCALEIRPTALPLTILPFTGARVPARLTSAIIKGLDKDINTNGAFPACKKTIQLQLAYFGDPELQAGFYGNRLQRWYL
jgi:hypothetical protein